MPNADGHPKGWKRQSLGDVAALVMGQSPPGSSVNGDRQGVPFLQGNGEFGRRSPEARAWCTKPGRLAEQGDLLISVRAPVGELNVADQDYCIGRGLGAIRVQEEDRDFIWSVLHFERWRLQRVSQGSTFDAINRDELEQLHLLIPPPLERRRIGEILTSVEVAIDATRQVIERARQLKTAVLQDLFTRGLPRQHSEFQSVYRLGDIPAAWDVVPLRQLAEIRQGIALGPHRKARLHPTPYLRVANVHAGRLDLAEIKEIEVTPAEHERYALRINDVLMVEGHANIRELGRAALVTQAASNVAYQNHLFRVRTKPHKLDPRFLTYWVNSDAGRNYFRVFGGTTSGLNTVGSSQIGAIGFPTPAIEEQLAIADLVQAIDIRINSDSDTVEQLSRLRSALSHALLTGDVRVPTAEALHA